LPEVMCEICGENLAMYVCAGCGRRVCGSCIDLSTWRCKECGLGFQEGKAEFRHRFAGVTPNIMFLIGFLIISIGTMLIILAILLSGENVSSGVIIFIGPIPIIFGSGTQTLPILILALVITVLMVLLSIYLYRKRRIIWSQA